MIFVWFLDFFNNFFSPHFPVDVVKQEDASNAAAVELNSK